MLLSQVSRENYSLTRKETLELKRNDYRVGRKASIATRPIVFASAIFDVTLGFNSKLNLRDYSCRMQFQVMSPFEILKKPPWWAIQVARPRYPR